MSKTERSPTSQRPSVLFVDDEPHVIRSLMRCLRASLANWDVHVAPGGREALAMVETTKFHLIICDLNMPQVDGLTVLQHAAVQCPDALRVLLTGSLPMDHGQNTPVQIHLDKPTTPERLRDVLRMAAQ